jgi:predicted dehydrogenase
VTAVGSLIRLAVVGTGSFAQSFIPLFRAHPGVAEVVLCDLDAEKLRANCAKHGIARSLSSLEAACESDVDAVALFTQNWLHGPQAAQALRAGKHVYSAVPPGISREEVADLVRAVEESGRIYMLGETSTYYPAVLYARKRFLAGDFGEIVYGEAEYYHDFDHGLYDVMRQRGGAGWRETAGSPPMQYPTHSTSQILAVTGARMTHVSCQGFVDRHEDGLFRAGVNRWDNPFSNESALFRMSDGSLCRINEFRRVGHPGAVRMTLYGTRGGIEESVAGAWWVARDPRECVAIDRELALGEVDGFRGVAPVHPVARLPRGFRGLPSGHAGSHQFLVDDFVRACLSGETPPNNVWQAARYVLPGIVAHESAVRGGELLSVPDLGDAPPDARPA